MRYISLSILCILCFFTTQAQIKIHSHNDYTHAQPFTEAASLKVWSIEADVFVVNGALVVAHSRKEINPERTLEGMYLQPIAALAKTKAYYSFQLMIDPKDPWDVVYPPLKRLIDTYKKAFKNKCHEVVVTISGNRPPDTTFHTYGSPIRFDGLPGKVYRPADLAKITMISADFSNYSTWNGLGEMPASDKVKLKAVIADAHALGKPMRFWGAPDNQTTWELLISLGADIINTDKPAAVRNYLKK